MADNLFNSPTFNVVSMTDAINVFPNKYGRIEQLKLMKIKPIRTRKALVEFHQGVLSLLPTMPLGAPATVGIRGKRSTREFVIPHIPHDDVILPEEVQDTRAFGSENALASFTEVMANHLETMRNKHAITLEHLRMGALKGIILDADGSALYDLYTEFGIVQKVITFQLSSATFDVKKACLDLKRHIEDNLFGAQYDEIRVMVSPEFFDALTGHAAVLTAYDRWQNGEQKRSDMRHGFEFCGIVFEEYRAQATDSNGSMRRFIAENEGHAFPVGSDIFKTYAAPADFNEAANTPGREMYAKVEARKFERGADLHTQANVLPMCTRPALLVKVTKS